LIEQTELNSYVRPEHLQPSSIAQYRGEFRSHPAHVVVIHDYLRDEVAARISRFLSLEVRYGMEYEVRGGGRVAREDWLRSDPQDRLCAVEIMVGVRREFILSPNLVTCLRFQHILRTGAGLNFFEEISGYKLTGIGFSVRSMSYGQQVLDHVDDSGTRRLAFSLYLTPGWEPCFGGALCLTGRSGHLTRVEAEYNCLVVFDATIHTLHHVTTIENPPLGLKRLSLGGWLHGKRSEMVEEGAPPSRTEHIGAGGR